MADALRSSTLSVIALASAALACGALPAPEGERAPSLDASLRAGRPARAIVLLDDAPAQAAAARVRALRAEPGAAALREAPEEAAAAVLGEAKAHVLAGTSAGDVEVLREYAQLPALQVELRSAAALERLRAQPGVLRVVEDEPHQALLAESLPLVHQPTAAAAGALGQGTAVAVLDTGVDYTREAFGTCPAPGAPGCRVAFAHDFAPDDGALDPLGHGTNVAAIVAGVAPATKILALDVFDGQYAYTSDILAAIDWVIANRARYNIVAINMSLGSGGSTVPCSGDVFAGAIRSARAAGILSTVAAGNDGRADQLSSPACVPEAVSVGAVYDAHLGGLGYAVCADGATAPDQVACFSNSASFLTVLAPGALITAGGITMAGTSQAAPHVAGAVAVWKGVLPDATPDEIVARLRAGPAITDPRNGLEFPRLDLAAAGQDSARTAPTATLSISGGAAFTRSLAVALAVGGADPTGLSAMCLSNTPRCDAWRPLNAAPTWSLAAGPGGVRTVYLWVKDGAGNASAAVSRSIVYDVSAPAGGRLGAQAAPGAVTLAWSGFADAGSGVARYTLVGSAAGVPDSCAVGTPLYAGTGTGFVHAGLAAGTRYTYRLCATDGAGNTSAGVTATVLAP